MESPLVHAHCKGMRAANPLPKLSYRKVANVFPRVPLITQQKQQFRCQRSQGST
ncbi:hypothetical protein F511_23830 [Dorcoceras hygrometricum]|uniref:Uncharacterized protein n=1 Tax=Dorcoceras hygrometricum TaxID=472368 RepID=A0A2Z7C7M2_9LAMI|nr:hypothetical protein F511_23830 [Dorcoceras hygrometricum]